MEQTMRSRSFTMLVTLALMCTAAHGQNAQPIGDAAKRAFRAQEGVNSLKVVGPHAAAPQCAPEEAGAAAKA
jgi:hypothetical protein